jgi:hypothetical protein
LSFSKLLKKQFPGSFGTPEAESEVPDTQAPKLSAVGKMHGELRVSSFTTHMLNFSVSLLGIKGKLDKDEHHSRIEVVASNFSIYYLGSSHFR